MCVVSEPEKDIITKVQLFFTAQREYLLKMIAIYRMITCTLIWLCHLLLFCWIKDILVKTFISSIHTFLCCDMSFILILYIYKFCIYMYIFIYFAYVDGLFYKIWLTSGSHVIQNCIHGLFYLHFNCYWLCIY